MNFALTKTQLYVLAAAAGVAILWLLNRKAAAAAPGRVTSSIAIDANVLSPTFGEPIVDETNTPEHQRMLDLIDESNAAIASYDATHPEQT